MFRILHLSDLHANAAKRWSTDALLIAAKDVLLRENENDNIDVLAFTGDIADGGREDEYQIAGEWINDFCLSPAGLNLNPSGILFSPKSCVIERLLDQDFRT